jgi:PTH1 family peptidyl-tRNA hydrolase
MLALPLTYMNESGYAVSHLVRYFHVPRHRLVVVCDEMDLPFGTLRIRTGGSSAGNRGLKSVITELGSQDFARLRVGVGRPRDSSIAHVLGEFPPEEAQVLPQLLETAADAVTVILRDGTTAAMNAFNRDWLPQLRPSSTA